MHERDDHLTKGSFVFLFAVGVMVRLGAGGPSDETVALFAIDKGAAHGERQQMELIIPRGGNQYRYRQSLRMGFTLHEA